MGPLVSDILFSGTIANPLRSVALDGLKECFSPNNRVPNSRTALPLGVPGATIERSCTQARMGYRSRISCASARRIGSLVPSSGRSQPNMYWKGSTASLAKARGLCEIRPQLSGDQNRSEGGVRWISSDQDAPISPSLGAFLDLLRR